MECGLLLAHSQFRRSECTHQHKHCTTFFHSESRSTTIYRIRKPTFIHQKTCACIYSSKRAIISWSIYELQTNPLWYPGATPNLELRITANLLPMCWILFASVLNSEIFTTHKTRVCKNWCSIYTFTHTFMLTCIHRRRVNSYALTLSM